jgi:hypothetical protein
MAYSQAHALAALMVLFSFAVLLALGLQHRSQHGLRP